MARRRAARSNRRSRKSRMGKRTRQQIARVSNNAPLRCSVPNDPPQIISSLITNHLVPFRLIGTSTGTANEVTNLGLGKHSSISVAFDKTSKSYFNINITTSFINKATCARFGFTDTMSDYSLNKIQFWAATAGQSGYQEQTPLLIVDSQSVSGGISVSDIGTMTRRAKLGVSIPFKVWYRANANATLATLQPDLNSQSSTDHELGWLVLSVTRRCAPSQ